MSVPEKLLWSRLCGRQVGGLKFRRNYKAGPYIVTFYCDHKAHAIDLVGSDAKQDHRQDAYYAKKGITLSRLVNNDVTDRLDEAMRKV
jgi:very-short-patch-repair endonuclease